MNPRRRYYERQRQEAFERQMLQESRRQSWYLKDIRDANIGRNVGRNIGRNNSEDGSILVGILIFIGLWMVWLLLTNLFYTWPLILAVPAVWLIVWFDNKRKEKEINEKRNRYMEKMAKARQKDDEECTPLFSQESDLPPAERKIQKAVFLCRGGEYFQAMQIIQEVYHFGLVNGKGNMPAALAIVIQANDGSQDVDYSRPLGPFAYNADIIWCYAMHRAAESKQIGTQQFSEESLQRWVQALAYIPEGYSGILHNEIREYCFAYYGCSDENTWAWKVAHLDFQKGQERLYEYLDSLCV